MTFCPLGQGGGLHLWHYFVAASVLCVHGDAEHGGCASPFLVLGELGTSPLSLQVALRLLFRFYNEKLQISSWHFLGLLLASSFPAAKGILTPAPGGAKLPPLPCSPLGAGVAHSPAVWGGQDTLGPNGCPRKNADSLAECRLNKVCLGRALGCTRSCRGVVVTELQARRAAAKRNGSPGPAGCLLSSGNLEELAKSQAFSFPQLCSRASCQ